MNIKTMLAEGGGILVAIMTLIQISPIKVNPWTTAVRVLVSIIRAIGKILNGAVIDRVDQIGERMDSVENELKSLKAVEAEREAVACRTRILRFGDECLHDTKHSKEHFDQILRDIDVYETYCDAHEEFENNQAVMTIELIKQIYRERFLRRDFL